MSTQHFYAELPPLDDLLALANPDCYREVPSDWYVLITDVVGSTEAIANGRYKEINLLGASSIIAVLNALPKVEIPFIFGGDGASIVVPPQHLRIAQSALLGVQAIAAQAYELRLRVGVVPVEVVNQHHPLKIAKFRLSPRYCQASFMGGGITFATELIKQDERFQVEGRGQDVANLAGLECRWQEVPSPYGHTVSLIVTPLGSREKTGHQALHDVLQAIRTIYGESEAYHPITDEALRLAFDWHQLTPEVQLRSPTASSLGRWRYAGRVWLENLLGWIFMRFGLSIGGVNWRDYKSAIRAASDYQKIDDALRMVIAGSSAQTQQLVQYLEQRSQAGQLAYGLHISDRAVLTCLILDRQNRHFHLVDGAGGGYTLAAQDLKLQLRHKATNWKTYARLARQRGYPPMQPFP